MIKFASSTERTLQSVSLLCLGSVFGTKQPLPLIKKIIGYDNEMIIESSNKIFVSLIMILTSQYSSIAKTECTQVLCGIAKNYPRCIT